MYGEGRSRTGSGSLGRTARAAVALGLVVVGCGSAAAGDQSRLRIEATEFEFSTPDVTIQANQQITLEFHNAGEIDHEWVIIEKGVHHDTDNPFEEESVLNEVVEKLPAGESFTGTFTIPEPGQYQLLCALPGHVENGMVGTLTVTP
ncbi:MAG: plastocyanin/azurin family copper-binding protein [Acidimicrobiales bacterium]